jgi:hypothetical protein
VRGGKRNISSNTCREGKRAGLAGWKIDKETHGREGAVRAQS